MANHSEAVAWREWGEEAFAEARAQDKPVLLDIGAVWCHWCHVMDHGIPGDPVHRGTYDDDAVRRLIAEDFIPIKVDNDRRPDINARYNMGGWPSTVFLTPEGDTLYGETYVPPDRMIGLLGYLADLWQNNRAQITEQTLRTRAERAAVEAGAPQAETLDRATVPAVVGHLLRQFDPIYGGFGTQPKFPHPAALQLALEQYARTGDAGLRDVLEKTLGGMADGGMYDRYAGGFFRYSTTRDWSVPHFEKMLEDNAKLTAVYARASVLLNDPRWLDVVRSAHGWLLSDMRDPRTGVFAGSQDADAEERYYGHPLDVRATLPTPYIDRTIYTGWNALTVSALVERFKISGEPDVLQAAQDAFVFMDTHMQAPALAGNEPRDGDDNLLQYCALYHFCVDDEPQGSVGLLSDETAFLAAALDLHEATGQEHYRLSATETAAFILDYLEDRGNGGFFDLAPRPGAIGELARPKKDMTENAEAALALLRLSALTDAAEFRHAAERALKVFAEEYGRYGYHAAAYARAVDAALGPPVHIVIVGPRDGARTQALQHAAWRLPLPGKAAEWLEDGADRGFPRADDGDACAYVCIGTECRRVASPADLASAAAA